MKKENGYRILKCINFSFEDNCNYVAVLNLYEMGSETVIFFKGVLS